MRIADILVSLNADLANEWRHLRFYLYHSSAITGLHAHEYKEFLTEQAASEMRHVQQFADLIIGLGGEPTAACIEFPKLKTARDILLFAAQLEAEVVRNYTKRISELADIPDDTFGQIAADKKWIEIFLEEQIKDSREDFDHIRQILEGLDS